MDTCNSERVSGLTDGAFGEVPAKLPDLDGLVACENSPGSIAPFRNHQEREQGCLYATDLPNPRIGLLLPD